MSAHSNAISLRSVFERPGPKYSYAVELDTRGLPVTENGEGGKPRLVTYRASDETADGKSLGCPCCFEPLVLVHGHMSAGEEKNPYFRSKGPLDSHLQKGCTITHHQNDKHTEGHAQRLYEFVATPAPLGKRKILYLNIPDTRHQALRLGDTDHGAAIASLHYVPRTLPSGVRHFLTAASADDVATYGVRSARELTRLIQHPLAHADLIAETDVVTRGRRFPLSGMIAGRDWEGLYDETYVRQGQDLSFPALAELEIDGGQKPADGIYLSVCDAGGREFSQIAVLVRAGDERGKIEKMLHKGGRYSLYGVPRALDAEGMESFHARMQDHDGYVRLKNLKVLAYTLERANDIMPIERALPVNRLSRRHVPEAAHDHDDRALGIFSGPDA